MAAGQFPSPTRAQCKTPSFPRLSSSFSHGSPSFPRGHADQGGRPWAGSEAALPRCVSPPLGGGDGGSRGGAGWSSRPVVNAGGAPRGGVDGTLEALPTCRVCSRSFHGLEELYLHMKICPPAPAAAEPPALRRQQEKEKKPSMAWTRTRPHEPARAEHVPTVLEVMRAMFPWFREEYMGLPCFAEFVSAAKKHVADKLVDYFGPAYVKSFVEARISQVKTKVPAASPTAISDPHAGVTVAIAPAPPRAAAATLAPVPLFVPAAGAPMVFAPRLATPAASDRGGACAGVGAGAGVNEKWYACKEKDCGETFISGKALGGHVASCHRSYGAAAAAVGNERWYACERCGETFNSGKALGGHVAGRHRDRPSLARVPAVSVSSFPPGIPTGKRPAMDAASPRNGKRRCIRLFGVDVAVEALEG